MKITDDNSTLSPYFFLEVSVHKYVCNAFISHTGKKWTFTVSLVLWNMLTKQLSNK